MNDNLDIIIISTDILVEWDPLDTQMLSDILSIRDYKSTWELREVCMIKLNIAWISTLLSACHLQVHLFMF